MNDFESATEAKFYDFNYLGTRRGSIYHDATAFGLTSSLGNWAVRSAGDYTALYYGGIAKLQTASNGFNFYGDVRLNSSGVLTRSTHNSGHLEGGETNIGGISLKTNPIFTRGSLFNPNEETLGGMTGVGFTHGNASFINTPTGGTNGWGMYVAEGGDANIYLNAQHGQMYITDKYFGNGGNFTVDMTIGDGTHGWFFTDNFATINTSGTLGKTVLQFQNDNGTVGTISTTGTATAYNTSSDPRLKDFKDAPSDAEVNAEFDKMFSCFRTFTWKNDAAGDLVWGFDAHACIDSGSGIGVEGEGSRELDLDAVYEEAVTEEVALTESVEVMEEVALTDEDGVETGEYETVGTGEFTTVTTGEYETKVVTPEKKVTPAGVDQSKAVPILLAKIEQLERRLSALEG